MSEKSNKVSHLELIQATIIRMAASSFLIKGWSVTLVSAMFALSAVAAEEKYHFVFLAYFPSIAFWILDGYYLGQEKLFRKLYDHVRKLDDAQIDFSMDTSRLGSIQETWFDGLFSWPGLIFHMVVLLSVIVVTFWNF
ncbi:MAG: hypothetical protein KF885_00660 [Anaerolineales bacterium]|nr:hypothetical protein [Anaerolineales bacterium]